MGGGELHGHVIGRGNPGIRDRNVGDIQGAAFEVAYADEGTVMVSGPNVFSVTVTWFVFPRCRFP